MDRYIYIAAVVVALWLLDAIRRHLSEIQADIRTIYFDMQFHAPTPWNVISLVKERQKHDAGIHSD
jgi:hypothetical protein